MLNFIESVQLLKKQNQYLILFLHGNSIIMLANKYFANIILKAGQYALKFKAEK